MRGGCQLRGGSIDIVVAVQRAERRAEDHDEYRIEEEVLAEGQKPILRQTQQLLYEIRHCHDYYLCAYLCAESIIVVKTQNNAQIFNNN